MALEFSYPAPACGESDRRPAVLKDFHYLYFALLLCGLTAIIIVIISFYTEPIPDEKASSVLRLRLLGTILLSQMTRNLPFPVPPLGFIIWIMVSATTKQVSFGGQARWGMNFQVRGNPFSSKLCIVYLLGVRRGAGFAKINGPYQQLYLESRCQHKLVTTQRESIEELSLRREGKPKALGVGTLAMLL